MTHTRSPRPELGPANYFPPSSLNRPLPLSAVAGIDLGEGVTPLELAARLRAVYCGCKGGMHADMCI